MPKEKVTFTIDAKVIEKARKLDINLSRIAETVLKSFTYSTNGASKEKVYEGYQALFEILTPLLAEYQTSVAVGAIDENVDEPDLQIYIVLHYDGRLEQQNGYGEPTSPLEDLKSVAIGTLFSPMRILENLLNSLYNASEAQKKRLEELELARRMILAIQPSILKSRTKPITEEAGKSGESA
jgi:hypothetical protein